MKIYSICSKSKKPAHFQQYVLFPIWLPPLTTIESKGSRDGGLSLGELISAQNITNISYTDSFFFQFILI